MIEKTPVCPKRIRRITGSFAFLEHRFLRDGFWESLSHHELLLHMFLVLVADRAGLSYYSFDKICTLLRISTDEYLLARNGLIQKDLIAFDGYLFQTLSLPDRPVREALRALKTQREMEEEDPATIGQIITDALGRRQ